MGDPGKLNPIGVTNIDTLGRPCGKQPSTGIAENTSLEKVTQSMRDSHVKKITCRHKTRAVHKADSRYNVVRREKEAQNKNQPNAPLYVSQIRFN